MRASGIVLFNSFSLSRLKEFLEKSDAIHVPIFATQSARANSPSFLKSAMRTIMICHHHNYSQNIWAVI